MDRPTCAKHPGSTIWRDGNYGPPPRQRQRWKCVPKKRSQDVAHVFTELLPRQRTDLTVHRADVLEQPGRHLRDRRLDQNDRNDRQHTATLAPRTNPIRELLHCGTES